MTLSIVQAIAYAQSNWAALCRYTEHGDPSIDNNLAERMLRAASPPTAIFASNDDMAAAVVSMARKFGLDLPGQLSVAGFDDAPVACMIWPELTTVRQPVAAMARIAADLIIRLEPRRNGWPDRIPRHLLDHELVIRNSTARPARR